LRDISDIAVLLGVGWKCGAGLRGGSRTLWKCGSDLYRPIGVYAGLSYGRADLYTDLRGCTYGLTGLSIDLYYRASQPA